MQATNLYRLFTIIIFYTSKATFMIYLKNYIYIYIYIYIYCTVHICKLVQGDEKQLTAVTKFGARNRFMTKTSSRKHSINLP